MQNLLTRKCTTNLLKHVNNSSTLSIDDKKTKKNTIGFAGIKILNNNQNTTIFTQEA